MSRRGHGVPNRPPRPALDTRPVPTASASGAYLLCRLLRHSLPFRVLQRPGELVGFDWSWRTGCARARGPAGAAAVDIAPRSRACSATALRPRHVGHAVTTRGGGDALVGVVPGRDFRAGGAGPRGDEFSRWSDIVARTARRLPSRSAVLHRQNRAALPRASCTSPLRSRPWSARRSARRAIAMTAERGRPGRCAIAFSWWSRNPA